jgi:hypothetical protein
MPTRRNTFGIAALNGKIYAVGGWAQTSSGEGVSNALEVYDTATDTWTTRAPMPTARNVLAAAVLNGKIYALGGWTGTEVTSRVEVYDPRTDTWSTGRPMNAPNSALSAAVLDGKLYAMGGATVEVYDPRHDSWKTTASHNWAPRYFLAAAVVNRKLYALGGSDSGDVNSTSAFYDTVQSYDPATDSWIDQVPLRFARNTHTAVVLGDTIYLVGGMNWMEIGPFLATVETYQPGRGHSAIHGPLNDGRNCLGAVAVNGKIYAIGGWDWNGASGAVELYAYPSSLITVKGEQCVVWGNDFVTPDYKITTDTVTLIPQALDGPAVVTCKASGLVNGTGRWLVLKSDEHPGYGCYVLNDWLPGISDWVEYIAPNGDATLFCWY